MNIKPLSDYHVKDYLSFHEPGPLHTYDRMYVPGEHKYDHLWKYKSSNRPGSQIIREEEEKRPRRSVRRQPDSPQGARKPVKRLQDTPQRARRSDPPPRTREVRNSPRAGAPTSTTRRPRGEPMEMWQYKDYLSYHEPGPYHDYRSNHAPGHHPYNHMWTYNVGNRQGSQHVRVEEKTRVQRPPRVVTKPRTATPKPNPRQQAARKTEPKATTRAVERKVATPPPPAQRQQPNRRMAAAATTAAVVTQPRRHQAPPPAGRAPPPARNTTPPPAHTTLPPRRTTPPATYTTLSPRRATPPRSPIQYRAAPHPLLTETAAPAAVPLPERAPVAQGSRIPVRQRHQEAPLRLESPEDTGPMLRREYKLRPESKWNAPRLDGPALTQKQRPFLRNYREVGQPRPPWKPIKTYNGTPRQGPLSTNYGDHTLLHHDYSNGPSYARSSYNYVPSPLPNYSYEPSYYYTGSQDPLSSIRRTMVLFGS